ncbi:hypothetical protein FHX70_001557 [Slackia isoflavoniconvertens]|nr:hypothetical protein [Slackia isoflavoniconvertens]
MKICVFCSSSDNLDAKYVDAAKALGEPSPRAATSSCSEVTTKASWAMSRMPPSLQVGTCSA